jgi:hypothetical protein
MTGKTLEHDFRIKLKRRRYVMKLKIGVFIACWGLLSLLPVQAEKVAVFEEFGQPESMVIGNGFIYILEKTTIFIYNLKDFKFVKKFGKEGEGPGEIKRNPFGSPIIVTPYQDKVYVSNTGKLSVFSKTGEYEKEYKIGAFDGYSPFGKKYICYSNAPEEEGGSKVVLTVFLADENLKKSKILYKSDVEVGPNGQFDFPINPFYHGVDGDKLFIIAGTRGFAIDAFDEEGKKLYEINKDYKRLKVPPSYKDKTLDWFKKAPNFRQFYDFIKTRMNFKEYYPPIFSMLVDSGELYIMTNLMKKELRECIVTDLKGKELKRVFLPIPEQYGLDYTFHITIYDNHFYKLEENFDDENWELHRQKL